MNIAFILKGNIRRQRALLNDLRREAADRQGVNADFLVSEVAGQAVQLAREAAPAVDYLIAVGGDGTLHEVVNGCMQAVEKGLKHPPVVGLLPRGTANDFLKSTSLDGSIGQLLELIAAGSHRQVDLGHIRYHRDGQPQRAFFINMADIGIGAAVVRRLEQGGKNLGATLSYLSAILATFPGYRRQDLRIALDDHSPIDGPVLALLVGNGRCFGSSLYAVPGARIDDGLFHVTRVGDISLREFLRELPRLRRGLPIEHPEVSYHTARRVSVDAASPAELEAEGEFLGTVPCQIDLVPGAIRFLMPGD